MAATLMCIKVNGAAKVYGGEHDAIVPVNKKPPHFTLIHFYSYSSYSLKLFRVTQTHF